MTKVVSFSLWGSRPKYVTGMLRNAEQCGRVYAGWQCRVYCGRSVPEDAVTRLEQLPHVRVVRMTDAGDWNGMFWRFFAATDADVDVAVFRDADSRVSDRERAAVEAWLRGSEPVHVMRDHPLHTAPILGGMWGVRGGGVPELGALLASAPTDDYWQVDQDYLAVKLWPLVRHRTLVHDEYFARRPFPTRRRGRAFVGQPFDEHDRPEIEGPTALERRVRQSIRGVLRAAGLAPPPVTY